MADPRAAADAVERDVLARISPSPELVRHVAEVRAHAIEAANRAARERSSPMVRALVAGSAARGTFLVDRFDLDLFVLFPPELSRERLETEGMAIGRALLTNPETRYAQHPYLRGRFEDCSVEVVPGYAVADGAHPLTAVDRTPFHQAWLETRETPALVDQVRLAKQFLRAHGLYGSEARTGGFSGYLVELLVLRFGGFRAWLEAARAWTIPMRLANDPAARPRVPDDVALVVDDPVDPQRNVSTALTRRNLATLILAAEHYLAAPNESAFVPRASSPIGIDAGLARSSERGTHVAVLSFARPPLVDDILYPQLAKAERAVASEAERLGFAVMGTSSAAVEGDVAVVIEVGHRTLPAAQVRRGPPVGLARADDFLAKWTDPAAPVLQGPYVTADGELAVETVRPERHLEGLLTEAWPHLPVGKDLRAGPPPRVRPLADAGDSAAVPDALAGLFGKRLPWRDPAPPRTAADRAPR